MRFEWDPPNAVENRRKHRIGFEEACTIFADPSILTIYDDEHSEMEDRWATIGRSLNGQIMVVIHTWPERDASDEERIRLIPARRANRRERIVYERRKL